MRLWMTIALLGSVLTSGSISHATEYPRSKGPVSDYAGKLSQAQVTELTSLIQAYERQTSIEIAVVVVDSLQDQTAREYAIGIGNSWGVGKTDRNNGIVLLWAPNERAYSLRVADGLSEDLSDADATDITRSYLIPNFRRENYYGGLKETVDAVIRKLGEESWDERVQAHEETAWLIPGLIAGLSISAVSLVAFYRHKKRRQQFQEMVAIPASIAENLRNAEKNAPRIHQLLDDFKREMPEQDLTRVARDLEGQPNRIAVIRTDVAKLDVSNLDLYQEALRARDSAEDEGNLLTNIHAKLNAIRQAKAQSQTMMSDFAKESFQIEHVKDGSKRDQVDNLLLNSRSLYDRAYQDSSMSMFDWMLINDLLNDSRRQVQQAVQVSQTEPYTPPPIYDSSSGSTLDTGSLGSSSDFSGGDFGGGGFGGGGGFDGGSGSDGSY